MRKGKPQTQGLAFFICVYLSRCSFFSDQSQKYKHVTILIFAATLALNILLARFNDTQATRKNMLRHNQRLMVTTTILHSVPDSFEKYIAQASREHYKHAIQYAKKDSVIR